MRESLCQFALVASLDAAIVFSEWRDFYNANTFKTSITINLRPTHWIREVISAVVRRR